MRDDSRKIQNKIKHFALSATFLSCLITAFICIYPFFISQRQIEKQNLIFARDTTILIVDEYLSKMEQVAKQISTRTKARMLTENIINNKVDLQPNKEFLAKILKEAITSNQQLLGLKRINLTGEVLVEVGEPITTKYYSHAGKKESTQILGPFSSKKQLFVSVVTPIFSQEKQHIATDITLFDITNLRAVINTKVNNKLGSVNIGRLEGGKLNIFYPKQNIWGEAINSTPALSKQIAAYNHPQNKVILDLVIKGEKVFVAYSPLQHLPRWGVAVIIRKNVLLLSLTEKITYVVIAIVIFVLLTLWILQIILTPLSDKIIINAQALYREIENSKKELMEINCKLEKMALKDSLTNLPNRYGFKEKIEQAIGYATRNKKYLALFFIDIDNFKTINDSLGHSVGDLFLTEIASRLKQATRAEDHLARLGGDEFAIVFENINKKTDLSTVANKLKSSLSLPVTLNNKPYNCSASIGIAVYPFAGTTADQLLKNADIAMYRAKERGKNSFVFFSAELDQEIIRIKQIESALNNAIENDEFYLVYQPILNSDDRNIVQVETLIRWRNEDLQNPSPDEFITIAEQSSLIVKIGRWVLERSLQEFELLINNENFHKTKLAINVSAKQLFSKAFLSDVKSIFKTSAIKPSQVVFEITETAMIENIEQAQAVLKEVNNFGIEISLDDFGSGNTSILYLNKLSIDILKIDKAFIRDITLDENSKAIVRSIITMCRELHIKTIAEGVENPTELQFLEMHGCNMVQGYLFYKPLKLGKLIQLGGNL